MNAWLRQHLLQALTLEERDHVLDVGYDHDHLPAVLQPRCRRLAVVDLGGGMDATALDFPSGTFDKVVTMHALQRVPGLPGALAEMARVHRRGGRMVHVYPWEPFRGCAALPRALAACGGLATARRLHLYRLDPRRLNELLGDMGMRHLRSRLLFLPPPLWPAYLTLSEKE